MHVGLNLIYLAPDSGGTGTYARGLIPALLEVDPGLRLTLFTSASEPRDLRAQPWAGEVHWTRVPVPGSGGAPWTFFPRTAAQWGALPLLAARRGIDVVHGLAYLAPVVRGARTASVVSVHDLIWMHDPQAMTRLAKIAMRLIAPPSIRAADRVITGSAHAAQDIARTLGIPAERIAVVAHGAGGAPATPATPEPALRRRLGLGDGPLVLAVGQRRSHKNLGRLIEGFGLLDDGGARLVLAGAVSPQDAELQATAERVGVANRTVVLDWVDPADLEGLYGAASCLALPSLHEGFGFTAVEAMARGVPVVCSEASSLSDTAAGAAFLFDPHDPESIATALRRVLADERLRAELVARGLERARTLSWRASAAATLAVYGAAIRARRGRGSGGD
jgi:glycosyltransferase involved in cell wall biosynthesis